MTKPILMTVPYYPYYIYFRITNSLIILFIFSLPTIAFKEDELKERQFITVGNVMVGMDHWQKTTGNEIWSEQHL